MIIQCPKCETKFRVPDAKVASAGVKVRCSKCAHLFVVRKNHEETPSAPKPAIPAAATLMDDPTGSLGSTPPDPVGVPSLDPPAAAPLDAFSDSEPPSGVGRQDPFDWSGAELAAGGPAAPEPAQTDVDPFLGPGAPRFSSSAGSTPPPGPPPLPPRNGPATPFSEDLAPSEAPEDDGSLRFPPPPALTNDLAPEAEEDWSEIEAPPTEAIGDDPFQAVEDASLPPSPPLEAASSAPPVDESASPSQEIPIMRGRADAPPIRRSVDIPVVAKGPGPRAPAPVSSLRWPPWLGIALGLAAAFYAVPDLLGDESRPAPSGSAELETLRLRVSPYARTLPPELWVVSGTAETKSRPYPNGVQVEVRLPGRHGPVLAQAILGQDVPESVLAAGPEAVAQFMRLTPAPSLGPASRKRFVTIVDVEPQPGDIDVRYEALPPPEPPIAVDGSEPPG